MIITRRLAMGQQNSADDHRGEQVPYTKYSHSKPSDEGKKDDSSVTKGITVVNPHPEATSWKSTRPIELQKLEKVHRFWPILKSSIDSIPPQEKISNGIGYKHALEMCQRFQLHLGESAKIVSSEQQALASRLRDIEMFSAGISQQIIRREERMQRVRLHLQKVSEVEKVLEDIHCSLAHCIPLVQSLNNLLPDKDKLETFQLQTVAMVRGAWQGGVAETDGGDEEGEERRGREVVTTDGDDDEGTGEEPVAEVEGAEVTGRGAEGGTKEEEFGVNGEEPGAIGEAPGGEGEELEAKEEESDDDEDANWASCESDGEEAARSGEESNLETINSSEHALPSPSR